MTSLAHDLTELAGRGLSWWTGELASLMPRSWREDTASTITIPVIGLDQGRMVLASDTAKSLGLEIRREQVDQTEAILDALSRKSRKGRAVPVTLRLPYGACLARRIDVPERARADASRILGLDLERATPLNIADVYTATYTAGPAATKGFVTVIQLIAKRALADAAVQRLEAAGAKVERIDCWSEGGTVALPVNFLAGAGGNGADASAGLMRTHVLLAGLAALLAISAVWISVSRHKDALAEIVQQTALERQSLAARTSGQGAEDDALQAIRSAITYQTGRQPAVHILDELTRLLPDSAYLMELSFEGDSVSISGFAKNAAQLVPLLERSEIFAGATLSAPVTFDGTRDKERFSYKLNLRHALAAPAAPDDPAAASTGPILQEPQEASP